MLKKFFFAACVLAAVFAVQFVDSQKVFAQDVWVFGERNGTQYYVVTETFQKRENYDYHFDVNVKYVRNGKLLATKRYSFDGHDSVSYKIDGVDQGLTWSIKTNSKVEPATSILNYCTEHFGLSNGMGE